MPFFDDAVPGNPPKKKSCKRSSSEGRALSEEEVARTSSNLSTSYGCYVDIYIYVDMICTYVGYIHRATLKIQLDSWDLMVFLEQLVFVITLW